MTDSEKLDKILEILEGRSGLVLNGVSEIEATCRACGLSRLARPEDGGFRPDALAELLRFYVEHHVRHSPYGSAYKLGSSGYSVDMAVSFQKNQY